VWELEDGRAQRTLEGHSSYVFGVAVTPDGKRAVSASWDNTLKVWDLGTEGKLGTFKADVHLYCCAVCPDGETILAGDGNGVIHVLRLASA
jgi:WD40 repeat protein